MKHQKTPSNTFKISQLKPNSAILRGLTAGLLLNGFIASGAIAEEVKIPVATQGSQESSVSKPYRGQTMTDVIQTYGAPEEEMQQIGNPPISRWRYPGYTVYFEYDVVLHSVNHPAL